MPHLQRVLTVLFFAMFVAQSADSQIVINELDPSGPGIDDVEFVELYGSPNDDLTGFTVVIFNGSNAQSNNTFDLTGYSLDANGFFLSLSRPKRPFMLAVKLHSSSGFKRSICLFTSARSSTR